MAGKDARNSSSQTSPWKTRLSLIIGIVAVISTCAIARYIAGVSAANAQAPRTTARQRRAPVTTPQQQATPRASARAPVTQASAQQRTTTPRTARNQVANQNLNVVAHVNNQQITRQQLANECLKRYGSEVIESIVNNYASA